MGLQDLLFVLLLTAQASNKEVAIRKCTLLEGATRERLMNKIVSYSVISKGLSGIIIEEWLANSKGQGLGYYL